MKKFTHVESLSQSSTNYCYNELLKESNVEEDTMFLRRDQQTANAKQRRISS